MRTLKFLLKKEFRQIFRNKSILRIIIVMPIIQLLIMPLAAEFEIKKINVAVVDNDKSQISRQFIDKVFASNYFQLVSYAKSYQEAFGYFETDRADLIIEIPPLFDEKLNKGKEASIFIGVNAINGTKASVGSAYLNEVLSDFNPNIRTKANATGNPNLNIEVLTQNWYNPFQNYQLYMVPAILVMLVTMIAAFMSALNIVKEKEIGTIEQINVTPVNRFYFILGKLIPFWVIGVAVFSIGLFIVAKFVYQIESQGSLLTLYVLLSIYLIALLGIGLLISTYSSNQQQAMSVGFFVTMVFILMSGLFTPIDSMPTWAKWIAALNPVTYFIDAARLIILKGSSFYNLKIHFVVISSMAVVFNAWAVMNYRKTV